MRILEVSILNVKVDNNGVTNSISTVMKGFSDRHIRSEFISPYHAGANRLLVDVHRRLSRLHRITTVSMFTFLSVMIKTANLFLQIFSKRNKFDLIHAHDIFSAFAALLAAPKRSTVVLTVHFYDLPWNEFINDGFIRSKSLSRFLIEALSKITLKNKRLKLIFISNYARELVNGLGIEIDSRSATVYHGVRSTDIPKDYEGRPYILNIGRIDDRKNQLLLVDVLFELKKLGLDIALVLVGRSDPRVLDRIRQRRLELRLQDDDIRILGQRSPEEVKRLYRNASLYFSSSRRESFGLALIEAMSFGLPVFAMENGSSSEVLPAESIFSIEDSPALIAEKIAPCLRDETVRTRLCQIQDESFREKFSIDVMMNGYLEYFEKSLTTETAVA